MDQIGQYTIVKTLRRARFSTLYLGRDASGQSVAIKVLDPDAETLSVLDLHPGSLSGAQDRFQTAANALRRFGRSRYIIEAFNHGRTEDMHPWYAMAYRTKTMASRGAAKPDISQVGDLIHAVAAFHDSGVVHGDIRAANICLSPDGGLELSGLGSPCLPRTLDMGDGLFGQGSDVYIAPEQRGPDWRFSRRADVFSLGVLAHRLLGGKVDASKSSLEEALKFGRKVTDPLQAFILKAVSPKPGDRYHDAAAMLDAFDAALVDSGMKPKPRDRDFSALARGDQTSELDIAERREHKGSVRFSLGSADAADAKEIVSAFVKKATTGRGRYATAAAAILVVSLIGFGVYQLTRPEPLDPAVLAQLQEQRAFEDALALGTQEALLAFQDAWPDSDYGQEAQSEIEAIRQQEALDAARAVEEERQQALRDEAAWQQALALNTDVAYRIYAAEFPNGKYIAEIQARRDDLAFARAQGTGTLEALLIYRQQWPNGRHLEELDDAAWLWAREQRTDEALDQYVAAFPAGRHVSEVEAVKQSYIDAVLAQQKATDDAAWSQAQRLGTVDGYEQYLDRQSEGAYRVQARDGIARIRAQQSRTEARTALVRGVQAELERLNYAGVTVTGIADEATSIAIQSFERWTGRQELGRVTASLLNALQDTDTKPLPGVGQEFRDCLDCPEMIVLPAGSFIMGSAATERARRSDEGPQRRIVIPRPFAIGKYEVTFRQWAHCVGEGGCAQHRPSDHGWGREDRPVIYISWHDAKNYVVWLSQRTGQRYRLLSEAEWEYAARAGSTAPYSFGNRLSDLCRHGNGAINLRQNRLGRFRGPCDPGNYGTAPVGSFAANGFGLFDMHGNVQEWVEDCWRDSYADIPASNRPWSSAASGLCERRVARGGAWGFLAADLRSAARLHFRPTDRFAVSGFRVAMDLGS